MRRLIQVPLLATLFLLVCASVAAASTITVTRTDDPTGDQNCLGADTSCSLRQAIDAENGTAGGDKIVLADATYSLTQGTDIIAAKPFDLEGAGVTSTTIDGSHNASSAPFNPLARILRVDSGATVVIRGLTFTGGFDEQDEACSGGCSTINANGGGDLFNNGGNVTLDGVAFTDNFSSGTPLGGAVSNGSGSLTMNDVSFTHNAAGVGGALFTRSGTVSGNGVTFSENSTTCCEGGAAYLLGGTVTLVNTTITSSSGFGGGEISNGGANLTLDNVTLSATGSDIQTDRSATTTVENTILATPSGQPACVASGRPDSLNNNTTGPAITGDLGNNLAQDKSCGLLASGDKSNVDPRLAPLFDNGGPTQTQALLAGSPALGDPATTNCPATDQRGDSRPSGKCDIGAFEATLLGSPTATTGDVEVITDSSAKLTGTINLQGEAGGFHFLYGTSPDDLSSRSDEIAAGVVSTDTSATETLSGLTPDTKYFFKAVADNASDSTPASTVGSFTTQPGPPIISNVSVDSISDTAATVHFSINPQGSATTYLVEYGSDTGYGQRTPSGDAGSNPGPVDESVTLTGLDPGSTVHFDVVATNEVDNTDSGDHSFDTLQQITGATGQLVTVTDGQFTFVCPTTHDTTVDWADDSSDTGADIQCSGGGEGGPTTFELSDSHIYGAPGTYEITIDYANLPPTNVIAHISANPDGLTNTAPPAISGSVIEGQTLTTTNGGWDGNPTGFDYQWQDCDANGHNCTDTGEDASSYTLTEDDLGQTVRVIVTASTDNGHSDSVSDPTGLVTEGSSPPTNTGLPAITGTAQQGQTLTTTDGTWDGNPTHFDYQWQDCDANGQNCVNTGTDTTTYALTSGDVGHTVQVVVTATGAGGAAHATSNRTAQVIGPAGPPAQTTPSSQTPPSSPTVGAANAQTVNVTSAGFSGSVTPNGLPTQAYFQYGLDPKYSGGGPIVYDQSTSPQSVGADFTSHFVGPVAITGLLPNALYHVRLVASNSAGTTFGPDATFTTAAAPAPSPPTVGKTVDVTPVSGFVLIKINGKFVPLTGAIQIPNGSQIDARHGSLELITSTGPRGKTQHGTFGGAIFRITQAHNGLATLSLLEGAFKGAPSYALCKPHKAADATIASSKTLQLLKASAHGKFRTSGRYSAATVRGTVWTVADRCDGTLTHVITDSVAVTDFVRHKTIILHAGQSYLALAKRPHKRG
jgi:hypothetical protein